MSQTNEQQQQQEINDVNSHSDHLSPLSSRFLVAHSSPVYESITTDPVSRHPDDSFQSSSSNSNSKSSSSTHSHTSRFHLLMMQHHSAVNSPLAYSRCTSLGSLSSFDIRSSCNESYTSECSSIKPSGIISPSDIPDSPPCEPEILAEEDEEEERQQMKPINRTLTMNTTSSLGRTTMMGETVIEKTFVFHQQEIRSNQTNQQIEEDQEENDDGEHLDEVIVYTYDTSEMNKPSYNNELLFDDDSYRICNTQTDENNSSIDDQSQNDASFNVPSHENLSAITEESSLIEDLNSNDETNSIKILYDLIKKPHWTKKTHCNQEKPNQQLEKNFYKSFSSDPSSLSLNSHDENQTDDEDEYDQEKGRQLIQRLIEETLARRSLRTDYLHSTACSHCPLNTPLTTDTRSVSSCSSSSSTSTKSCSCTRSHPSNSNPQIQRSQSSPARPCSSTSEDSKRQINKQKENVIHHTRASFLRLRQAQQNKRLNQQDKRI